MNTRRLFSLLWLIVLLVTGAWASGTTQPALLVPHPAHFFILSESGQAYPKLRAALELVGFAVQVGRYNAFLAACATEHPALVVPRGEGERLTEAQQRAVLDDLHGGRLLILDASSVLAGQLGAGGTSQTAPLSVYRWSRHPTLPINLPEPTTCPLLTAPAGSRVLADDPASKAPLTISGSAGRGHYLIDALPLEPAHYALYQYQPFLLEGITQTSGLQPVLANGDFGVYVDYGYHDDEQPEALAARLHLWGIRHISFSAWYDLPEYRVFLHRFLLAAHQRGMQVEAWLELPMVSIPFWQQHPEWRQRTASGRPAQVDWRYLMALENPDCLRAVTAYVARLINAHDWDGINLAEVYFESPGQGFEGVNVFTPMNDLVPATVPTAIRGGSARVVR